MSRADYAYHWLIVNTRSFYYYPPGKGTTPDAADCMALCPLADHFNHAARGVRGPSYDPWTRAKSGTVFGDVWPGWILHPERPDVRYDLAPVCGEPAG